jgi:hypothetical protein
MNDEATKVMTMQDKTKYEKATDDKAKVKEATNEEVTDKEQKVYQIYPDGLRIQSFDFAIEAYIAPNGEYHVVRVAVPKNSPKKENSKKIEKSENVKKYRIYIYLMVLLFGGITYFLKMSMILSAIAFVIADMICQKRLTEYICLVAEYYSDKDRKRLKRINAATNMIINAYCQLSRVPTREELLKFSRFLPNDKFETRYGKIFQALPYLIPLGFFDLKTMPMQVLIMILIFTCLYLVAFEKFVNSSDDDANVDIAYVLNLLLYMILWLCFLYERSVIKTAAMIIFAIILVVYNSNISKLSELPFVKKPTAKEITIVLLAIKKFEALYKNHVDKIKKTSPNP